MNGVLTVDQLLEKKSALTARMEELKPKIASFGISANQVRFKPHTVNQFDKVKKDKLVSEYNDLTREVININREISKRNNAKDFFRAVVKECLPDEIYSQIIGECLNREKGQSPIKLNIDFIKFTGLESKLTELRKFLLNYNSKFITARQALTEHLQKINDPIKLRELSEVNKNIPPIEELKRDRKTYNF